jgi:hypothetical protein
MENNNREENGLKMDEFIETCRGKFADFDQTLRQVGIIIGDAIKSTGLPVGVYFNSLRNTASDKEGYEYTADFSVAVDMGKFPG